MISVCLILYNHRPTQTKNAGQCFYRWTLTRRSNMAATATMVYESIIALTALQKLRMLTWCQKGMDVVVVVCFFKRYFKSRDLCSLFVRIKGLTSAIQLIRC